MITLSNGKRLDILAASGALGFDGRGYFWEWPLRWIGLLDPAQFTVITKTLTLNPRAGNLRWYAPWSCIKIKIISGRVVNAVNLSNPGIEWWIKYCYERMRRRCETIVSIYAESPEEIEKMIPRLNPLDIVAIEIVVSCPNTQNDLMENTELIIEIAEAAVETSEHPIIIKQGAANDYLTIARRLEGKIEAIEAINSVPWKMLFPNPDQKSPLAHLGGGGVSGKIILPIAKKVVADIHAVTSTPIIACGGITSLNDMIELKELGASAFSIGTLFLLRPWLPTPIAKEWKKRTISPA